jgi:RNA polymerase sigma-70 factor (ECF subfamily)
VVDLRSEKVARDRADRERAGDARPLLAYHRPVREDAGRVSDAALVERVRAGDTSAFTILYRTHAPDVAKVVQARLHDTASVADGVQETFTRALEQLDSLRDAQRFRPWLLAIARNTSTDQLRHRSKVGSLDDDIDGEATDPSPEELAEMRELARLVRGCVAGLSRRDATVVALVADFGFTPVEVAEALAVNRGAAKVIVHRARQRLKESLTVEVLVRRHRGSCPALWSTYESDGIVSAGRHVRSCAECARLASEVEIYDAAARSTAS